MILFHFAVIYCLKLKKVSKGNTKPELDCTLRKRKIQK